MKNKPKKLKVTVTWREVVFDVAQQAAWDRLWRKLLSPIKDEPTKGSPGGTETK